LVYTRSEEGKISRPVIRISIAAIALSVIVMLLAVASGKGLQTEIRNKTAAFSGHITITNYDQNTSYEPIPIPSNESYVEQLAEMEDVDYFQAFATKAGVLRTAESFDGIVLKGVDSSYNWTFFSDKLIRGHIPDLSNEPRSILISEYTANRLEVDTGERVIMSFIQKPPASPRNLPFRIAGIYNSGYEDFDKVYALGDIAHIRSLNKWDDNLIGGFEVFLKDYDQLENAAVKINKIISFNTIARTVEQNYAHIFDWLNLFDLNIAIVLMIMAVVSAVNMITVLLIMILERTRMIGILKALGASSALIQRIFVRQAVHLILRGLIIGNAIGLGIMAIQKYTGIIRLDEATYYVSQAPIQFLPIYIFGINLGTLLICWLIILIPARIITKIKPARAIRFD
jgi:lipoprotein-releasing system permease protein